MNHKGEEPEGSPRKRALCGQKKPACGSLILGIASVAVALVLVLGGEGLSILAGSTWREQAKLQADYTQLAMSLADISDFLPEMEAKVERMIEQMSGTFESKFWEMRGSLEDKIWAVQNEQWKLMEAAKAAAQPPPAPLLPKPTEVQSPTTPSFILATVGDPEELKDSISKQDLHWRLLRRFFLERAVAEGAGVAGAAQAPLGSRLVVDAGCRRGAGALFAAAHGRRALCFEPDPELTRDLEQGLLANKDSGHLVWAQRRALGAKRSPLTLPGDKSAKTNQLFSFFEAQANPLDEVLFEPVELMRVDVEGNEIAILQGSKSVIEHRGVEALLLVDMAPGEWSRAAGTTFQEGLLTLNWVQAAGQYKAYILASSSPDGPCPAGPISKLGVAGPAGEELRLRRANDKGEEGAGARALRLAEPFSKSAEVLLRAMHDKGWKCSVWMEQPAGAETAAAGAAAAAPHATTTTTEPASATAEAAVATPNPAAAAAAAVATAASAVVGADDAAALVQQAAAGGVQVAAAVAAAVQSTLGAGFEGQGGKPAEAAAANPSVGSQPSQNLPQAAAQQVAAEQAVAQQVPQHTSQQVPQQVAAQQVPQQAAEQQAAAQQAQQAQPAKAAAAQLAAGTP